VIRTIEGKTDKCAARFDTVAGTDRIPVLRMHFHFDGKEYEATYRWQSDPDTTPNRLISKRFSQSTNDRNEMRKVAFDFNSKFSMLNAG
jgi:hypothetical protein